MKRWHLWTIITIGSALFFLLLLLPMKSADNLYDSVIRIHVLANSDSEEDQKRKIQVRDEILAWTRENFPRNADRKEAEDFVKKHLGDLERIARSALAKSGSDDAVQASIGEEYYPSREYAAIALPAGNYLSLRIQIGKAQGKNWWCVLFPPLCLDSAVEAEDALLGAGMEEENVATLMGKEKNYRVRFKILELFGKTKKTVQELF